MRRGLHWTVRARRTQHHAERRDSGEAKAARDRYAGLPSAEQAALQTLLSSLVLFPPDDTASNLDPGDPTKTGFPQFGHGSIKLTVLFNDPTDLE